MYEKPNIKKKYFWFVFACCAFIAFMTYGYSFLGFAFALFPRDYQWILGLLSPLAREFYIWGLRYFVSKGLVDGSVDDYKTRLSTSYYMETRHAIFLAIILGSIATPITCYCVIGIKIAYSCF